MVVCDYGQILSSECLASTPASGINLHGSLLQDIGGLPPFSGPYSVRQESGSIDYSHDPRLDAGPVVCCMETEIGLNKNAMILEGRLSRIGADCLSQAMMTFADLGRGKPLGKLQDGELATKAPRLSKSDALLKPEYPVRILDRQVRGLQPWPGCFANVVCGNGQAVRLLVREVLPIPIKDCMSKFTLRNTRSGSSSMERDCEGSRAIWFDGCIIAIVAADGLLGFKSRSAAGKREMSGDEFIRGYSKMESISVEAGPPNPLFGQNAANGVVLMIEMQIVLDTLNDIRLFRQQNPGTTWTPRGRCRPKDRTSDDMLDSTSVVLRSH